MKKENIANELERRTKVSLYIFLLLKDVFFTAA